MSNVPDDARNDGALLAQAVAFKVKQLGMFYRIHDTLLKTFVKTPSQIDAVCDPLMRAMTVGIKMYLPCYELASYRWPATWWDALKERWWPAWATHKPWRREDWDDEAPQGEWWRRWLPLPPRYSTINIDTVVTNIPLPRGSGAELRFMVTKDGQPTKQPNHPFDSVVECPKCHMWIKAHEHPKERT